MRRLYRSKKDRVISGICGGIGEYFKIDPVIVRVIAVALLFMGGAGIIAYIIGIFIIPEAPNGETAEEKRPEKMAVDTKGEVAPAGEEPRRNSASTGALVIGIILVVLGGLFLMRNFPLFDDYYWWVRTQLHHFFWPGILVLVGIFMIFKSTKK
jgi:phage shock protein C